MTPTGLLLFVFSRSAPRATALLRSAESRDGFSADPQPIAITTDRAEAADCVLRISNLIDGGPRWRDCAPATRWRQECSHPPGGLRILARPSGTTEDAPDGDPPA